MRRALCLMAVLVWPAAPALAEVLVLQDQTCIEDAFVFQHTEERLQFYRDGRLFAVPSSRVLEVTQTTPEGCRLLAPGEFPGDITDVLESGGSLEPVSTPEPTATATPSPVPTPVPGPFPAAKPVRRLLPEPSFRIQDVRFVPDADFHWTLGLEGIYTSSGTQYFGSNTEGWNEVDSRSLGQLALNTAVVWDGTTLPLDWFIRIPLEAKSIPPYPVAQPFATISTWVDAEITGYWKSVFGRISADVDMSVGPEEPNNFTGVHTGFAVGFGRIYRGRYAYQALQVVDDLRRAGLLKKTVGDDDLQALSERIASARNWYTCNQRFETRKASEAVCQFLQERGLVDRVAGILQADETYRYAPDLERGFGSEIFIRYARLMDQGTPWIADPEIISEESQVIGLGTRWAWPLSRSWQLDLEAGLDYPLGGEQTAERYGLEYIGYFWYPYWEYRLQRTTLRWLPGSIRAQAGFRLAFIPGTQLWFELSNHCRMAYGLVEPMDGSADPDWQLGIVDDLAVSMIYPVSELLRFEVGGQFRFSYAKKDYTVHRWDTFVWDHVTWAGFRYALF